MRLRLHHLIFAGMILGAIVGTLLWREEGDARPAFAGNLLWTMDLIGRDIFVGALKMIIAPLILASIVAGVTSLPRASELGSIGWKTLGYYIVTTSLAVTIGLVMVLTLRPGLKGSSLEIREKRRQVMERYRTEFREETGQETRGDDGGTRQAFRDWVAAREGAHLSEGGQAARWSRVERARERTPGTILKDQIGSMFSPPFHAMAVNESLGIIFFALLIGIACHAVGDAARPVVTFFQGFNTVIMKITVWLMSISPLAIFCLMGSIVAEHGPGVFRSLGWYCGTVVAGIGIHVALLLAICAVLGKVSPIRFLRGIREAWLIAFGTRSSAATLPVTLRCARDNLGVSPKVANFTLPIGATMNMDGTALYEGVAVIFLLQIFSPMEDVLVTLGGMETFLIFITAVVASISAAAVPDAGLVTMVLVATAVGLPIYYLPFIFAVDAFLDMFRTSTNVMGDSVGAIVVDRWTRDPGDSPA